MTQNLARTDSPTLEAELLRSNPNLFVPKKQTEGLQYEVWMSNNGGYFQLNWSETIAGSYDWIGLFVNDTVPNTDYIGGNNWQWATRGSSYKTNTPVQAGYQVRYLVWNAQSKQYEAVAKGNLR
jgi:hypothetical protein